MPDDAPSFVDQTDSPDSVDRYKPAIDYVALDRAHRKRSRWSRVLVVSVAVLIVSLAMLGVIALSYLQGQMKYANFAQKADLEGIEESFEDSSFNVDWDALLAINPDTVGWVYVPGTSVNYPVVQGRDNDYYLSHDFNGDQGWLAQFGAVFLDWRNSPDWADQANFIYGHHMNDGSMFAGIAALANQEAFDESRTVYLLSPEASFKLRSFALIHCASDDPIVQVSFDSSKAMIDYIQDKIDRSIVNVGAIPAPAEIDKVFAFATCDNYSSGRYVLYAYIEREMGRRANAATDAAVRSGGAAGKVDDIAATASADASGENEEGEGETEAAEGESGNVQASRRSTQEGADAIQGEEASAQAGEETSEYAGGYYIYDEDGSLRWVSADEAAGAEGPDANGEES